MRAPGRPTFRNTRCFSTCIREIVEEVGNRNDVRRSVKVAEVGVHAVHPSVFYTHPLGKRDHEAFPRELRDHASPAEVPRSRAIPRQPCREAVEQAATFHSTTHDYMVASPSMVAAPTVRVQRSGKLRRCEQDHIVPNLLCLHLPNPLLNGIVHGTHRACEPCLPIAVHVPTTLLDKEHLPLGPAGLPSADDPG